MDKEEVCIGIRELLDDELGQNTTDLLLNCTGGTLYAHACIVGTNSLVIRKLICDTANCEKHECTRKRRRIEEIIEIDIPYEKEGVINVIRYMYCEIGNPPHPIGPLVANFLDFSKYIDFASDWLKRNHFTSAPEMVEWCRCFVIDCENFKAALKNCALRSFLSTICNNDNKSFNEMLRAIVQCEELSNSLHEFLREYAWKWDRNYFGNVLLCSE